MMVELAGLYLRSYPPTVETLDVLKVKVVFFRTLNVFSEFMVLWLFFTIWILDFFFLQLYPAFRKTKRTKG